MKKSRPWKIKVWDSKRAFMAGLALLLASSAAFSYAIFAPYHPDTPVRTFVAEPEANSAAIILSLEEKGHIKVNIFLKAAVAFARALRIIEAGRYYISESMSDWEIFRSLANPTARYVEVAAGLRKEEIADYLAKRLEWDTVQKREFVQAHLDLRQADLEGKYFPDTYLFPVEADPREVASQMVNNYEKEIGNLKKKYPRAVVNYDTAIIIASIIEREAAGPHDMRLISGIIWNRLFSGMTLSLDATIQYARGKTDKGWWTPIEAADIRTIESPYNTYKNEGLPPTPISNPSLAAIEAAVNPEKTGCFYYLHDSRERIHCSATGEGHERNVETYLR